MSEYMEQVRLFAWARSRRALERWPDLDLLECSLNGVPLNISVAAKAKKSGMLKGAHDIRLPIRRGHFVGLSIELKFEKGKPTLEQLWYADRLTQNGWAVVFCWGFEAAKEQIINYLDHESPA